VQRERLLEHAVSHGVATRVEPVSVARLAAADEVFLVNSVIDLWPVRAIDGVGIWAPGPLTTAAARWLRDGD